MKEGSGAACWALINDVAKQEQKLNSEIEIFMEAFHEKFKNNSRTQKIRENDNSIVS